MNFLKSCSGDVPIRKPKIIMLALPSIGNVGQLAMDNILATLHSQHRLQAMGCVESPLLLPVSGMEAFGDFEFVVQPLEVYAADSGEYVLLQQRSPVLANHVEAYTASLVQLVQTSFCCDSSDSMSSDSDGMNPQIVCLCGAELNNYHMMEGLDLVGGDGHFIAADRNCTEDHHHQDEDGATKHQGGKWHQLSLWKSLTRESHIDGTASIGEQDNVDGEADVLLGIPLATSFIYAVRRSSGLKCSLLGRFCNEGNNMIDGQLLAGAIFALHFHKHKESECEQRSVAHGGSFKLVAPSSHMHINMIA